MIRYSRVSLLIPCEANEADAISAHLGIQPTEVRQSRPRVRQPDGTMAEELWHTWSLDSPMSADAGDPTSRLWALIEVIRPSGERLISLDPKWKRFIDIVYHVAPQSPDGITVEFDWFRVPAIMMKILGEWGLDVSYEVFWHNHPDWKPPKRSLWSRLRRRSGMAV
jgi:hypothetical protein